MLPVPFFRPHIRILMPAGWYTYLLMKNAPDIALL
jgi:hypothetical protein